MTTPAIKAAQARLLAAQEASRAADSELKAAHAEMRAARLERDKSLQQAILRCARQRPGADRDTPVCIIKKTAKAVFVRHPGMQDEVGTQFRQDKLGRWRQYPEIKNPWDVRELIFPEGQS